MAKYEITLTNGYVHQIDAVGVAQQTALELRPFVASVKFDGREIGFDGLMSEHGNTVECRQWPHGKPMTFDAIEDRATD